MSNEIKVGDWTITEAAVSRLDDLRRSADITKFKLNRCAKECCLVLGIDPTTESVARDIAEEIVLHGTPVDKVIERLQRHLEGGQ